MKLLGSIIVAVSLLSVAAANAQSVQELRITPTEARAGVVEDNQIGSAGVAGVHTKVLFGDPSKAGLYSILLFVPAHITIQAHSHRDDRIATVVSGEWHFGYGDHFDAQTLKTLPVGSVYSEPGGAAHNHFAQTTDQPVIVQISGYGPTDTVYFEKTNTPKSP